MRAVLLLPFMVTVVIPTALLLLGRPSDSRWALGYPALAFPPLIGLTLIALGLTLLIWTIGLFARVGRGTLAPWDPTQRLVVTGPYRHVRNPMISGVLLILVGEAMAAGSMLLVVWATIFFSFNHAYFLLSEEAGLQRRFGEEYVVYAANVPRWIPRLRPWEPAG